MASPERPVNGSPKVAFVLGGGGVLGAHEVGMLRALLEVHLPVTRIEDLAVPFQCVAASVERAGAHWFSSGPVVGAVLASAAVPGLLPPVEIDGEHFLDGGLVHSIPSAGQSAWARRPST